MKLTIAFINGYKEEKIYLQITNFLSWLEEMAVLDVRIALPTWPL